MTCFLSYECNILNLYHPVAPNPGNDTPGRGGWGVPPPHPVFFRRGVTPPAPLGGGRGYPPPRFRPEPLQPGSVRQGISRSHRRRSQDCSLPDHPFSHQGGGGVGGTSPPARFFSGGVYPPAPWPGRPGACFSDCQWFAFRAVRKFFGQADGAGVVRA